MTGVFGDDVGQSVLANFTEVESYVLGTEEQDTTDSESNNDDESGVPVSYGSYTPHGRPPLNLTDEEINQYLEGMDPNMRPFGEALLREQLTWDELQEINAVNRNYPNHAYHFLRDRHNFWLPQADDARLRPFSELAEFVDSVGVFYKSQDADVKKVAEDTLRSFRDYSKQYGEGSYENDYYKEVVRLLPHRHAIHVNLETL